MRCEAHGSFQFTRQSKFILKEINSRFEMEKCFLTAAAFEVWQSFQSGKIWSND
jgi:hypothetical protein